LLRLRKHNIDLHNYQTTSTRLSTRFVFPNSYIFRCLAPLHCWPVEKEAPETIEKSKLYSIWYFWSNLKDANDQNSAITFSQQRKKFSWFGFLEFFYQQGWQYPALIDPFPENSASVLAGELLGKVQRDCKNPIKSVHRLEQKGREI